MTATETAGLLRAPHHGDRLRRANASPVATKRIVHLGVGAFHRAHQAWYTAHASDSEQWLITAFTGRSSTIADQLAPQGGVYTLIERGPERDTFAHIDSIHSVLPGTETGALAAAIADAETAVVTLTITESGYRLTPAGQPDVEDEAVRSDLEILRGLSDSVALTDNLGLTTALARLVAGLELRRRYQGPSIALVSCDNIPGNGDFLARGVAALALAVSPALRHWVDSRVSFVSTSVDRITPRVTADDALTVLEETGWTDAAPVVTEPFSDWVLSGAFPSGRPAWETSGATFVENIEPYEARKLWMLNGAHTLLAFHGPVLGHETVSEAIRDPRCRVAVNAWWDEAARHLPADLGIPAYRAALLERFENPRIEHRLEQIAEDGTTKLMLRIVPIALAELKAGRDARACAFVFATWMRATASGSPRERLRLISPELAANVSFLRRVVDALATLNKSLDK